MEKESPKCARCPYQPSERVCRTEGGKSPEYCPTLNLPELIEQSTREYQDPAIYEFARQASIQEAEGYMNRDKGYEFLRASKSRIEEIMEFARKLECTRLGLAFCVGLRKEAKIVEKLFSSRGFNVLSAICKVGRVPKNKIGLTLDQQISKDAEEAMCNPIMQAMVLNDWNSELNVLLGLCVGHDSLFLKYSEAPCTVLAVKDRMLGHNPLAAVYNLDSYYRSIK